MVTTNPAKRPRDFNALAKFVVNLAPSEAPVDKNSHAEPDERNAAAVALGKLGASKGGKAQATALSKKQRSAIATKAAKSHW